MSNKHITELGAKIAEQQQNTSRLFKAYNGAAEAAFMSAKSCKALDNKLKQLYVNFPRIVVNSVAERCRIQSFRRIGSTTADIELFRLWQRARLDSKSDLLHIVRGLYGAGYVTVWSHKRDTQRPVVMVDSPRTAHVETDPATGEVLSVFRVWKHGSKLYGAHLQESGNQQYVSDSSDLATAQWSAYGEKQANPWGMVPTVAFERQQRASLAADVLDLSDALAKGLQDMLVTSEYHSKPRRWVTGLEIMEDEAGNPMDPFGDNRLMQSEDPETEFGQLPAADLRGYAELTAILTQQVGSLTGLPPHYLGLHGDQPPNADAVRASETQLVSRCNVEKRSMGAEWAEVAGWLHVVSTGGATMPGDIVTQWESSETMTMGATGDYAQKLHSIGVPLRSLLRDPLRYEPHEIDQIDRDYSQEMARRAAFAHMGGN